MTGAIIFATETAVEQAGDVFLVDIGPQRFAMTPAVLTALTAKGRLALMEIHSAAPVSLARERKRRPRHG